MEPVCHRCHGTLASSDAFCPHCGAPQLRYEPSEENAAPSVEFSQHTASRNRDRVLWRDAILAALVLAVPAGILSSLVGLEALWVIGGGIATIAIYHRRTGTILSNGMGWRIGGLLGLITSVVAAATDGISLLVERFGLHRGAVIDERYHSLGQQLVDQMTRSNPEAASVMPWFLHFWTTPYGVAAMVLINAAGLTISMLLFAAAGGALGTRLTAKTAQRSAR